MHAPFSTFHANATFLVQEAWEGQTNFSLVWCFVSLLYLFSAYQRTFGFLGLGVGKVPFGGHIFLGTLHIYRDGRGG